MGNDNETPISIAAAAAKPKLSDRLHAFMIGVNETFCTLEAASAGLEKAENDSDIDLSIRAAYVVKRCCRELREFRDEADELAILALRLEEEAHG